jgi:hypothetical protein
MKFIHIIIVCVEWLAVTAFLVEPVPRALAWILRLLTALWRIRGCAAYLRRVLRERITWLACGDCLARLEKRSLPGCPVKYHVCRKCHRVYDAGERWGYWRRIVAVLDRNWKGDQAPHPEDSNVLCVSGLTRGVAMDADSIEIVDASDEQIERFVMSVHNDTDEYRRTLYPRLVCHVAPHIPSTQTVNRLRETFADVRQVDAGNRGQLRDRF